MYVCTHVWVFACVCGGGGGVGGCGWVGGWVGGRKGITKYERDENR